MFVRPARPDDARAIAEIQRAVWTEDYQPLINGDIAYPSSEELAAGWSEAISAADSRHRILVATQDDRVVGFAAVSQANASSDEIESLHVARDHRRLGHASRLLTAIADTAIAAGVTELSTWALEGDHPWVGLLNSSGFGLAHEERLLDLHGDGELVLVQHRWQTLLQEG